MFGRIAVFAAILSCAGCPVSNSQPSHRAASQDGGGGEPFDPGAGAAAGGSGGQTDAGGGGDAGKAVVVFPPVAKPNGSACAVGTDCASGFCADHVCCNTACDAQCYACDQAPAPGKCAPLNGQDDLSAIVACGGLNTCVADGMGGAACKLRDGQSCTVGTACASGFCADGVCCNTACDAQCFACNETATPGVCTPLSGQDDLFAVVSCAGVNTCAADASGGVACKLRDGEPCLSNTECASGQCRSYFVDADGDGYGTAAGSITRCDATANPPTGYAAASGDCCDSDAGAHPGVEAFFTKPDGCGNYDWNCMGGEEKQNGGWCPSQGAPGASIASCGSVCCYGAGGYTSCTTTQACR